MEVWSGSISTDTSPDLQIKLVNTSQRQETVLPKGARLSLRSLVNPALIPLYARAGPSVELHANTEETSEWLKARLVAGIWLDDEEDGETFERFNTFQCPVGLLVGVDMPTNRTYPETDNNNNVSDLLIYGILSPSYDAKTRPPSPPDSSSLVGDGSAYEQNLKIKRDLRLYAVPLAATYVRKVQDLPSPPSSAAEDDAESSKDAFAHFLPDLRSPSPKRKRILSLFEGAAQHHRRVRQRGGEGVSRMMANAKSQASSQLSSIKIKREVEELNSPELEKLESRRARSLSLGGSHLSKTRENTSLGEKARPGSSKSMLGRREIKPNPNSTMHTPNDELTRSQSVVPAPSMHDAASKSESQLLSSSPPANAEALVTRNKDLITRTILTCMRLYGYHRKANRPTKPAALVTEPESYPHQDANIPEYTAATTEEEEFKAMYHATYRAATFALRHYLKIATTDFLETSHSDTPDSTYTRRCATPILSKDTATNIIDGILKLFCDDQLNQGSG
ncbi:hypothetical protein UA08_07973 [Talaromyces atroroseus]|uniref:Sld7 C-terminal domain-containing protein n=1 Tax=Talaromyces atroroseus TaxID=1441469 RepID=A0A225ADH0_TALAT|nr:hypothetical protein UA08_07973 [Talaromyces atroroseus]OKL57013.1 hypothetical protein UA08_07973 [Talaromyces atroroseus]